MIFFGTKIDFLVVASFPSFNQRELYTITAIPLSGADIAVLSFLHTEEDAAFVSIRLIEKIISNVLTKS